MSEARVVRLSQGDLKSLALSLHPRIRSSSTGKQEEEEVEEEEEGQSKDITNTTNKKIRCCHNAGCGSLPFVLLSEIHHCNRKGRKEGRKQETLKEERIKRLRRLTKA